MIDETRVDDFHGSGIDTQLLRGEIDKRFARCCRCLAQLRRHRRRRKAPERTSVERRKFGVAHDHMNHRQRNMQLIGDGLRQRSANVLAHLDLAGENRDAAIFVDVNPGADIVRYSFISSAASGFSRRSLPLLGQRATEWNDEDDSSAEGLDKVAAIEMKTVVRCLEEFVTLSLNRI